MSMTGKAATGKLRQADIIKITQEILGKMNKTERQEAPHTRIVKK